MLNQPEAQLAWRRYDVWNSAIAKEFFGGTHADSPVYLDIEGDAAEHLAAEIGCAVADLSRHLSHAIAATIWQPLQPDPFGDHRRRLRAWKRSEMLEAPPVVALLAFFSVVAERMVADQEFGANNYYGRMTHMLGVTRPDEHDQVVESYRRVAPEAWAALNDWLIAWDGERGLPTARALDHRIYVSIAISQALVREHDRNQLTRMFAEFGLLPRQTLSSVEMRQHIDHWVSYRGSATSLTRLWARGEEVRERAVEIACAVLADWDGTYEGPALYPGEERVMPLALMAQLQRHPIPSIELYLVAGGGSLEAEGPYEIETASKAAQQGLAGCGGSLRLEDLQRDGVLSLEPWAEISAGDLLTGAFVLRSLHQPSLKARRDARPIIVLAFRESDAAYREIAQAPLMTRLLVLCREELASSVDSHLAECARGGFQKLTSSTLRELPESWVAFVDVEILFQVPTRGLDALVPAMDSNLHLFGGLQLGRDAWHQRASPELQFASAQDAKFKVRLELARPLDGSERREWSFGPFQRACVVPIENIAPPAGDFVAAILPADGVARKLVGMRLRLRSADQPRPGAMVRVPRAAFNLSPTSLLSPISPETYSSSDADAEPRFHVRIEGGAWSGMTDVTPRLDGVTALPRKPLSAVDEPDYGRSLTHRTITATRASLEGNCGKRGHHYWICDAYAPQDTRLTLKRQRCRDCSLETWTRQVDRLRRHPRRSARRRMAERTRASHPWRGAEAQRAPSGRPGVASIVGDRHGDLDLLLDAVSYQGGGSWEQFQQMARFVEDSVLYPYEAGRVLSSLGHIEIALDPETIQPTSYRVAPIALVEVCDGRLVLCGSRSGRTLRNLEQVAEELGVAVSRERTHAGITAIFFEGVPANQAAEFAELAQQEIGASVTLSLGFSQKTAALARPIAECLPELPTIGLGSGPIERFDLQQGRWIDVNEANEPGAYRVRWRGATYAYSEGYECASSEGRVVDSRTVKHLAARLHGVSLIGYEPERSRLVAAAGCELPALLERAAVMCSGKPSIRLPDRRIAYEYVPEIVARSIWRSLSS